jgi:hypothetical protein
MDSDKSKKRDGWKRKKKKRRIWELIESTFYIWKKKNKIMTNIYKKSLLL